MDELTTAIESRRKGKGVREIVEVEDEDGQPGDLLEALRASIEQSTGGRRHPKKSSSGSRRDGSLERLPKSELEQRARAAGISGRSKMSKDELVAALR